MNSGDRAEGGFIASRVLVSHAAAALMRELIDRHGPLLFHQSGGCCDGSAPMCYEDGDFLIGDTDVLLGRLAVGEAPTEVWISGPQFTAWQHTQLLIDAVPGRGAGFSLEAPTGQRFLSRARVIPEAADLPVALTGAEVEAGANLPGPTAPVDPESVGVFCG
ncbi:DUF779 domain-containing protein [Propioniferax innocua]|uniref:DUF779 domain-containing protein n=1 Tax=Propioniferax innocua TaxID=1753 RepID=A0A542ZBV8_9ACTN|nr:DUF779 domain-containing protein [Propioniferax innocua]TQL57838.1 hypothetical protein FB460_1683 [Propioniferax innocua]